MSKFKEGDFVYFVKTDRCHTDEFKIGDMVQINKVFNASYPTVEYYCQKNCSTATNFFSENELSETYRSGSVVNNVNKFKITPIVDRHYSLTEEKINEMIDERVYGKRKEKNCMKILEIYEKRIKEKIYNEEDVKIQKIIEEDAINKIIQDTENQINVILDNDEEHAFSFELELYTDETKNKIANVTKERMIKIAKLEEKMREVTAQLEIAETYETKIDILKRYEILTSNGKINDEEEKTLIEKIKKTNKK